MAYRRFVETTWGAWREPLCVGEDDRVVVARDLLRHIDDFLAGRDVSPAVVGHIEHLLDTFEGEDWQDELSVPVASYDPWGGDDPEHLYTSQQLGRLLQWAIPFIENEAKPGRDADDAWQD